MSFILDALKKAESERSRASGPVLVDVRIAPPRRRLPAWAWVLGAVLLANLIVLAWLMQRRPAIQETPAMAATAPDPAAATSATAPPVVSSVPYALPPPTLPGSTPPASFNAAPVQAGAPSSIPPASHTPAMAPADIANLPTQRDLVAAGVALPPLLLNLHVYDPAPASRYVMLNGVRLGEGEFTPDGIKVVVITERGVVLDARGQRFLLPAGG